LSITAIDNIFTNDPAVESKIVSVVTGKEVGEYGLYKIGERVFNLQRAILAREGNRGREADRVVN
jgi:aldehyde:ferredoxin oxidoreductase